eukprot:snap_masked-scaffold_21-processed-gene-5.64-mRNA-1 protein AED:0.03 eAED:0.06 QI:0/-1/0/1/-1/1/1/0/1001
MSEKKKVTVDPVLTTDPLKQDNQSPKPPSKQNQTPEPNDEPEEDKLLREKLNANAKKLINPSTDKKALLRALKILGEEIQTATSSLTSVPKPLKFLSPYYGDLKKVHERKLLDDNFQRDLSDVLSVMAMTMQEEGSREMLKFKMQGNRNTLGDVWGHEYVRTLCGEISEEFNAQIQAEQADESKKKELTELAHLIVPFLMKQNTETEAVDLLFEIENLEFLLNDFVDEHNFERTCLYLLRFADFLLARDEWEKILDVTYELYLRNEDFANALRIGMKMNSLDKVSEVFGKVGISRKLGKQEQSLVKKQMGLILGEHKMFLFEDEDSEEADTINSCIFNDQWSQHFSTLAKNLNMEPAKSPEDVYKEDVYGDLSPGSSEKPQSASRNLAATYVNAFVNCAFKTDKLLGEENKKNEVLWPFLNKGFGQTAAVASTGLVNLWSTDIDTVNEWIEYDLSKDPENGKKIVAGGLLALGVEFTGVKDQYGITLGLLEGQLEIADESNYEEPKSADDKMIIICGMLGLGLAYCGNPNESATDLIKGHLENNSDLEVCAFACMALALIHVGSGDLEVCTDIVEQLTELYDPGNDGFEESWVKFFPLAIGLIYLGKQDEIGELEVLMQLIESTENTSFVKLAKVIIEVCAYAGSGNVLQVQKLLHLCSDHINQDGLNQQEVAEKEAEREREEAEKEARDFLEQSEGKQDTNQEQKTEPKKPAPAPRPVTAEDKEKAAKKGMFQSVAVLGISLITFGEGIGREMAERTFQHLLQYGDLSIRRAIPLAMALSHVSDPQYGLIDILKKLSHDADRKTQQSAIIALGLMSAGTTNSRVAEFLRHTASVQQSDEKMLLLTRLSQGLLFSGKGLVTMQPFHSDRTLMNRQSVASVLIFLFACLDLDTTLLSDRYHLMMYILAAALRPRMMMTLKEKDDGSGELESARVKVRIGQALETVGQAGNPKKITGFQVQETPVLLNVGDRVELATEDYETYTEVLEGLVILKKSEDVEMKE